jgi:hypothetical protein
MNLSDTVSDDAIPDSYDYYLTVAGHLITKWVSRLAPAGVAREWLQLWNEGTGSDMVWVQALWSNISASAQVDGGAPTDLSTPDNISSWWTSSGCKLRLLTPVDEYPTAVAFTVSVTGRRPGTGPCNLPLGQRLRYALQVDQGKITKLVETRETG